MLKKLKWGLVQLLVISTCFLVAACGSQKTILMVMAEKDFYEPEYTVPREMLEKNGYAVHVITPSGAEAVGIDGMRVKPDSGLAGINEKDYKALLMVGGFGAKSFLGDEGLHKLVRDFDSDDKLIGAQCISPALVAEAGLLNGIEATCWPSFSSLLESRGAKFSGRIDDLSGNILTGQSGTPANIDRFCKDYLALLKNRHYDIFANEAKADKDKAPPELSINDGQTEFSLKLNGKVRTGRLHIPPAYDGKTAYSLVFGLHGAGGTGSTFESAGFDKNADEMEFIMCYPDGMDRDWRDVDDHSMIDFLISELQKRYKIDSHRIYVTGHSAGAIKAYELAQELPGKITAIAPVAGLVSVSANEEICKPVSVLHLHALDDNVVLYAGVPDWNLRSAVDSDAFWRKINGSSSGGTEFFNSDGIRGTLWRGESADTASLVYSSGRHGWLPHASDFISAFFYTHPARATTVTLGKVIDNSLPGKPVELSADVGNPALVTKVQFFAGKEMVGEALKAPYSTIWKNPSRGIYRITARAVLADGTAVRSSQAHLVWVADANIGAAGTVTVSSSESDSLAGKFAFDGNAYTRWASATGDSQWISIDLKETRTVSGFTLFWEEAFGSGYDVKVSSDGTAWTSVFSTDSGKGGIEYVSIEPVRARYVRIDCRKRGTEWGFSLWEVLVHGK